jgi:hypothetical protein
MSLSGPPGPVGPLPSSPGTFLGAPHYLIPSYFPISSFFLPHFLFLSVATARSQRTIVLPGLFRFMCLSVCCSLLSVGTDKNWNFSVVRSPIGLKLSGDLGLVSQISVHVLVSRFGYFYIVNKQKNKKKLPKSRKSRL